VEGEGEESRAALFEEDPRAVGRGRRASDDGAAYQRLTPSRQVERDELRRNAVSRRRRVNRAAVRRPRRPVDVLVRRWELSERVPLPVHDPDVVPSAPVGREGDPPSVRAVAREQVPRSTVREAPGGAALYRHLVDVTEKIEGDRAAVGRD